MAINFPTSLDVLINPTATSQRNNPSLAQQQSDQNDIVEALEAKIGINSSAVTTSHDYKLSGVISTDKAVSKTGTETLTNKTFTTPVLTSFYQDAALTKLMTVPNTASDTLAAIAATQILTNKTISGADNTVTNLPTTSLVANACTQSAVATSTSNTTTTNTNFEDLAGATATITTTGGNVLLTWSGIVRNTNLGVATFVQFVRNSTALGKIMLYLQAVAGYSIICAMQWIDLAPAAGSTTYKVQWKVNGNTSTCEESMFTATELKK